MNNQAARILFAVTLLLSPALVVAQSDKTDKPLVKQPLAHTYSIVARDPETGQLGVAVQSHWFSVGAIVPWAEAGVGAVATQSFVEPAYGPLGLALMRAGKSAPEALKSLLAGDSQATVRQVAMIDAQGRVASHTGENCIAAAGHRAGSNYSAQANLMLKDTVWDAMAKAFETSKGDLADRLMAALEAAQAEGGDIRGKQSAAIVVVTGKPTGKPWADRLFDLRVEDHPEPVAELKRLVKLQRAYAHMNTGDELFSKNDIAGAVREYGAAEALTPDSIEMVFWHAVTLANANKVEEALPLFKRVFAADLAWATLVPRLPKSKLLPDDQKIIQRILSAAPAQNR
ncbi:MAG TPA: DUF1028 domain-containing protein [Blastocatellia bacterium]|nr:DUF1028 domain-containing protein [Blastocatellia bacterium]